MSSDRREFLQQAGVVAGVGVSAFQLAAQQRAPTMPTVRASALMATFGLRYPIFCVGMGSVATPEIAIAVSNGGGLGAIGTGSRGPVRPTWYGSASPERSPEPAARLR